MEKHSAKSNKDFENVFIKAHHNVLSSASWMNQINAQVLKPFNISWQQFNILKILNGRFPKPATVKELTEKMIDKMSNSSRLVDKLNSKGLVVRKVDMDDRRRVLVHITDDGKELIKEVSKLMDSNMMTIMKKLSPGEVEQLDSLLKKLKS